MRMGIFHEYLIVDGLGAYLVWVLHSLGIQIVTLNSMVRLVLILPQLDVRDRVCW